MSPCDSTVNDKNSQTEGESEVERLKVGIN